MSAPSASTTPSEAGGPGLPGSLADIDATWLTYALDSRWPGVIVSSAEHRRVLHGAATKVQVDLQYSPSTLTDLPRSVWVKIGLEPHSGYMGEVVQIYANEARTYTDVLPRLEVNRPRALYAATQLTPSQSVVVLEDLQSRGATFPAPPAPLSVDQTRAGLGQLASLHAQSWGRPESASDRLDAVMSGASAHLYDGLVGALDDALRQLRAFAAPVSLHDRARFADALRTYRSWVAEEPTCVVHGDAHMNNLYFDRDGSAGFLDWQMCGRGRWAHDVGYFVGSALDVPDRRDHEAELLRTYLSALANHGATPPPFDEAWLDYRRSMFFGFSQFLFNWDSTQAPEYNMAAFARFAAAMIDLSTYEALDV